jgi:hypothetical protein
LGDGTFAADDGAVGGPIEMAGIAGRLADVGPVREAESTREGPAGVFAPTSMGRVTTTAGVDVDGDRAPVAGAGGGRGPGPSADWAGTAFAAPEVDCGPEAARDCGGCAAGIPRCVAFVATGVPFCAWGLGCWEVPAPRPSFGGRCIDGPSSAVVVDAASVSPFGLPEKSLEKTLIAEHQT